MAEANEPYPWVRQDDETEVAYEAFRTYLNLGSRRTMRLTAETVGKNPSLMERWAQRHDWRERARAFDRHMDSAETDGLAEELARVRNRHMELTNKLLDHLDHRLDHYIQTNQDPSVRWTQALSAATKAQEAALRLRETGKEAGMLEKALGLLEAITRDGK